MNIFLFIAIAFIYIQVALICAPIGYEDDGGFHFGST
jgi:hypothetical protein